MYAAGTIIDDQFQIVRHLGVGGMGNVYCALETAADRTVALKILSLDLAHDSEWRTRFLREGKALSRLDHKNMVRVYRLGVWQGLPYIAMEFLPGISLRRAIDETGKLSWQRALTIGIQICEGMECAHSRRVIHRDLKPENVMLIAPPQLDSALSVESKVAGSPELDSVKILDFGLARISGTDTTRSQGLTRTGTIIGSVHYMSPEQCLGRKADCRADVYSLGCLLYEMISGTVPFDADNGISLMHKHVSEEAPKLSGLVDDSSFPRLMEAVIDKAMNKDPARRYQTMTELRLDLQRLRSEDFAAISVAQNPSRKSVKGSLLRAPLAVTAAGAVVVTGAGVYLFSDQGQLTQFWIANRSASADGIVQSAVTRADVLEKEGKRATAIFVLKGVYESVSQKSGAIDNARLLVRLSALCRSQGNESDSTIYAEKAIANLAAVFDQTEDAALNGETNRIAVKALKLLIADGQSYAFEYPSIENRHDGNAAVPKLQSNVESDLLTLSQVVDRARSHGDRSGATDALHRALVDIQCIAADQRNDNSSYKAYLNAKNSGKRSLSGEEP